MHAEWSRDLDWSTAMTNVTIGNSILVDNPAMRRLEFIFLNTSTSAWAEYHFFYGRMKQDIDGNTTPIITGPHPMGTRSKHYSVFSGTHTGWSGDASTGGKIFYERGSAADAANGYDTSNTVPFTVTSGEAYTGGLSKAVLARFGYPKFETGAKSITITGTFRRDSYPTAQSRVKSFTIGSDKKLYWQTYADRHKVTFSDLTSTSLPALIGYELQLRQAGEA